jgi:hypothetical protein
MGYFSNLDVEMRESQKQFVVMVDGLIASEPISEIDALTLASHIDSMDIDVVSVDFLRSENADYHRDLY